MIAELSQVQALFQSAMDEVSEVRDLMDVRPCCETDAIAISLSIAHRMTLVASRVHLAERALDGYLKSCQQVSNVEWTALYGYGKERLNAIAMLGGIYADNPRA